MDINKTIDVLNIINEEIENNNDHPADINILAVDIEVLLHNYGYMYTVIPDRVDKKLYLLPIPRRVKKSKNCNNNVINRF